MSQSSSWRSIAGHTEVVELASPTTPLAMKTDEVDSLWAFCIRLEHDPRTNIENSRTCQFPAVGFPSFCFERFHFWLDKPRLPLGPFEATP